MLETCCGSGISGGGCGRWIEVDLPLTVLLDQSDLRGKKPRLA